MHASSQSVVTAVKVYFDIDLRLTVNTDSFPSYFVESLAAGLQRFSYKISAVISPIATRQV